MEFRQNTTGMLMASDEKRCQMGQITPAIELADLLLSISAVTTASTSSQPMITTYLDLLMIRIYISPVIHDTYLELGNCRLASAPTLLAVRTSIHRALCINCTIIMGLRVNSEAR